MLFNKFLRYKESTYMSYQDIEREPKIIEKKSGGGWLGRIIALVLGIVLGIVFTVGGVIGAGYLILNKWSVNETMDKVNGVAGTNIDVNEFLNKEYGDKTVLALLSDVTAVAQELSSGEGTFATLNEISPKVETSLEALAENFVKYGSNLSKEEIKFDLLHTPLKDFGAYLSDELINSIELGKMLLSTGSFSYETLTNDPLMMVFFYGVEGEDYVLDKENQTIVLLGDSKPLSIGDLRTNGITDSLSDIPLASLGFDDGGDAMMRVLLYGPANRYDVVDGKVQMKQVVYTMDGESSSVKFYDIDGNQVAATATLMDAGYTLTFEDGKTQFVSEENGKFYAYKDELTSAPVRYKPTTIGDLQNDAASLLDGIEIASALGVDESSNPILISLAYGVEGEDFYYENGKIVMQKGKSPKTIGDLKGGELDSVISDLAIDALVEIDTSDAMLCALAYGSSNRYTIVEGKAKMNQIVYTYDGTKFYDDKNAELLLVGEPETLDGVLKISFLNQEKETETQYLTTTDGTNFLAYTAYTDAETNVPALYKKHTVGDLQNDPNELLNTIELASVLNINKDSNPILITLAYGVEGEDFCYEDGEIVMYEGKYPKTIGDLKNGSMDEMVNNIPLDTLIQFDVEQDKMLAALAYGPSERYTIVDGKAEMNQIFYTLKDGTLYDIDGNEVAALPTSAPLSITVNEKTQYLELKADGKYYAYEDELKTSAATYPKNTIGDLQNDPNAILNNIPIADVMNVTPASDRILLSLAYGSDYKIVGEGENAKIQMVNGAKPRTIYDLQNNSDEIFKGLYIADALNVTKDSHPVLIALAYGEEGVHFDYVGNEIKMREGYSPRSLETLSGSNSQNLINDLTLEAALGVNKESQPLMKGLAFGQEGVHYTVNQTTGKIEMQQVFYVLDGETLKDANGNVIEYTRDGETLIVNQDDEIQYLKKDEENASVYLAYDSENQAITYKKATLGMLSEDSSSLLNNITVADVLGIKPYDEEEDALKKSIAYDKNGAPYTIGQLSNDPNVIIFNIHLDSVIEADPDDPLIMYLLYGKNGVHYTIKTEAELKEGELERSRKITVGNEDKYVVMLQQIVAVHKNDALDGNLHHIHNEYGEALYDAKGDLFHVTELTDGDYDYTYVRDGVTYFLKEYIVEEQHQQIRIVGPHAEENIRLYSYAYLVFAQDENDAINAVYYEHNSLNSMAGEDASLISNLTNRLTLEELLVGIEDDINSNFILKHLSHTVISELPHSIETLTIAQVFEKDVYKTDNDGNFVDANGNVTDDPSKRVLSGTWKYLLNDTTTDTAAGDTITAAEEYTLLQMNELMENMTGNVTKASLFELSQDGLITNLDDNTLYADINPVFLNQEMSIKDENGNSITTTPAALGYSKLGHFTVEHLLAFVTGLIS